MTSEPTITPNLAETAPAVTATPSSQGPGRRIRLARDAAKLSLEELAQQTKLAKPTLEALERDDFTLLNEAVYIRGYYRKVAKALSISESDLIVAYEGMVQPKAPPAPTKLLLGSGDNGPQRARRRPGLSWLLAVVVIGGLLFIASRFVGHTPNANAPVPGAPVVGEDGTAKPAASDNESAAAGSTPLQVAPMGESTSTPAAEPATSGNASTNATTTNLPSSSTGTTPAESSAPAAVAPSAQPTSTPSVISTTTPSAADSAAASANGVALMFKSTSWVPIEDTYGKVLLSGVMQAGEHQAVDGRRPLSVFLGNAPGVSVTVSGKPLDLKPYTKENATARFSVP